MVADILRYGNYFEKVNKCELRVIDRDAAVRIGSTEQALLIVVEIVVGEREIAALIADRGTVIVGHDSATDIEAVNGNIDAWTALVDDRLTVRRVLRCGHDDLAIDCL